MPNNTNNNGKIPTAIPKGLNQLKTYKDKKSLASD